MAHLLAPVTLFLVVAASHAPTGRPVAAHPGDTRVVAPLADPAVVPGVGRCTSDGACTVTDAHGTRAATPLRDGR